MSKLFSPIKIRNTVFKNRIIMPPMSMYSAIDGFVSDFHMVHYASRAIGGVSLIILEATIVEKDGRAADSDLGIWKDEHINGLSKISEQIKKYNCVAGIQLSLAGRKANSTGVNRIYAPSSLQFNTDYKIPVEMTLQDIKRVINSFKNAAVRAKIAGFDFIEIHAGYGYLLSSFLSPLTNKRTDEYGGNPTNRVKILGEIVEAIRAEFDGVICVRVCGNDYHENGNSPQNVAEIINLIKQKGIDCIDVVAGLVVDKPILIYDGFQVKFAEEIKKLVNLPTMVGGQISSSNLMNEIINNERADMVYSGRELLKNPNFALQVAGELKINVAWEMQYERVQPAF